MTENFQVGIKVETSCGLIELNLLFFLEVCDPGGLNRIRLGVFGLIRRERERLMEIKCKFILRNLRGVLFICFNMIRSG